MSTPPGIRPIDPDKEAARLIAGRERTETARLMQEILRNLGALSALVPPGPLRDRVDGETGHMTALWEALAEAGKPT